jgi:hypothetical protein
MLKIRNFTPLIAATAFLAIAGGSFVYAQQRFGGHGGFGDGGSRFEHRHRLSVDDINAFADARIAALKAGLELTPDQTKNWPPFEQALRDMVQLRVQRVQARQAGDQQNATSPFDRLARRADNMSKTSAALKHIADAGTPLYQSLNDAQKNRFTMLARVLRPHHRMHASLGGGWRDGQGFGRDGHGWEPSRRFGENGPAQRTMEGDAGQGDQL